VPHGRSWSAHWRTHPSPRLGRHRPEVCPEGNWTKFAWRYGRPSRASGPSWNGWKRCCSRSGCTSAGVRPPRPSEAPERDERDCPEHEEQEHRHRADLEAALRPRGTVHGQVHVVLRAVRDCGVGRRSTRLDQLLRKCGVDSCAFITAWNPGSRQSVRRGMQRGTSACVPTSGIVATSCNAAWDDHGTANGDGNPASSSSASATRMRSPWAAGSARLPSSPEDVVARHDFGLVARMDHGARDAQTCPWRYERG